MARHGMSRGHWRINLKLCCSSQTRSRDQGDGGVYPIAERAKAAGCGAPENWVKCGETVGQTRGANRAMETTGKLFGHH
jgi:hypothetical protein